MNDTPNNTAADIIEKIMQTAKAALPDSILPDQLADDVKQNIRAAIQDVISDLDVVTREELEVQKEVLKKTRAKVDNMEAIISDLEKQLDIK
ncbi:MAG: accessory factor UbiK family protein [Acidiferrobacterales bacterium]|nr:accessory factor UbiK family protein [Acidiferrobacterales bacterium]